MLFNKKFGLILLVIGVLISGFAAYQLLDPSVPEAREFHIAVAGPMDSKDSAGSTFMRSAKLFLAQNAEDLKAKGIKIVLKPFNDKNQKELAKTKAEEIVNDKSILGIIGHNYSSTSIQAGKVYKENRIPVITPTATNVQVTENNPWFFRTIFDDRYQGGFLSDYAKKVMHRSHVTIIQEDLPYGKNLSGYFEDAAKVNGLNIKNKFQFKTKDSNLQASFSQIAKQLKDSKNNDLIFLAAHYEEGVLLIKTLRDEGLENQIMTPDSFANPSFPLAFSRFPKEEWKPGYYTNNLFVAVPILYDSANQLAQDFRDTYLNEYGIEADWRAAFAYDAILVMVNAIEKSVLMEDVQKTDEQRSNIQKYLLSMFSPNRSIEGVTGLNYFDEHGSANKPITIGQYQNRELIPALTQLYPVSDPKDIPDMEEALKNEQVIQLGANYMYKTDIVYTGVQISDIRDIDLDVMTATIEFDLWFRYGGNVDVGNLEFLNAIKPVKLRLPQEEIVIKNRTYRRYHASGKFLVDFFQPESMDRHILGLTFAHKTVPFKNLIFVPDRIGGNDSNEDLSRDEKAALSGHSEWIPNKIWSFQTLFERKILGNIKYISEISKMVPYSQFVSVLEVKQDILSFRKSLRILGAVYSLFLLGLILGIWGLYMRMQRFSGSVSEKVFKRMLKTTGIIKLSEKDLSSQKWSWGFVSISLFILLYATEIIAIQLVFGQLEYSVINMLETVYDILWWVVPAYIITVAIKIFVWQVIEEKTGKQIPGFLIGSFSLLVYLFAFLGITAFVYDQKITSIIGTSGIFVMIIGLAIQINITNVFAGLVLNMERSINLNDWVKIGDLPDAQVVGMSWRTTKVKTLTEEIIHIPNSTISESEFKNYTTPNNIIDQYFTIDVKKNTPFDLVRETLLKAMVNVELVLKSPAPVAKFNTFTNYSDRYLVMYSIENYGIRFRIKGQIWEQIVRLFDETGIYSANILEREGKVSEDDEMDHLVLIETALNDE